MPKMLMLVGTSIFLLGLIWFFAERFGFKGLPGDISIQKDGFSFHFPIVTCIIISIIGSFLMWVVSSVLMAMGMMMLPPTVVSLPFKLVLFVLIDGWSLIVDSLVKSFSIAG